MRRFIEKTAVIMLLVIFFNVVFIQQAYAYLDPGSASYIFQLAAGFLFALLYLMKIRWRKIIAFLNARFGKTKPRRDDTKKP